MRVLLLSIIAKCGVFTHVRELAVQMQKHGMNPVLGFFHNAETARTFTTTEQDLQVMEESLAGVCIFFYTSEEELLQTIENMNITLVHAHSRLVFSSAIKVTKHLNVPFVVTLHGILNWSKLYRAEMEMAECIIAIGPEVAKSAGKEYQKRISIILNGIDIERYQPSKEIKADNDPLRIIWMGRTSGSAAKGAEYLARAVRSIQKMGIPIEAKAIGFAHGADTGNMEVYGWVHDPRPYLQWSQLVFARGRALREAMACGNVGLLIGQGYGGLVLPAWFGNKKQTSLSGSLKHGAAAMDVSLIVKDILYFHEHRNYLDEASITARRIAEENFNINTMVEQTCYVYQTAITLRKQKGTNEWGNAGTV
ncbi:MAG: glycosyltransferase family 4 protein [Firmicutes bacterium]|nr:glycosyltransferase family 4 protein [Bacillota bacterium]